MKVFKNRLTLGTVLPLDAFFTCWGTAPSTDAWYRTAVLQTGFFVILVIDMEDFALDFVFEFRPLLKYSRRKAVADEEVELFIPSLSELLVEPPEYNSPIPLGLTVELRISPAPCDDLAGICCVENVDSAELETGAAGRQLREFLPVPGLGGV